MIYTLAGVNFLYNLSIYLFLSPTHSVETREPFGVRDVVVERPFPPEPEAAVAPGLGTRVGVSSACGDVRQPSMTPQAEHAFRASSTTQGSAGGM